MELDPRVCRCSCHRDGDEDHHECCFRVAAVERDAALQRESEQAKDIEVYRAQIRGLLQRVEQRDLQLAGCLGAAEGWVNKPEYPQYSLHISGTAEGDGTEDKLNADSQNFEVECLKSEVDRLKHLIFVWRQASYSGTPDEYQRAAVDLEDEALRISVVRAEPEHAKHPTGDHCAYCLSQWPCEESLLSPEVK